jgi:hypothetical protein
MYDSSYLSELTMGLHTKIKPVPSSGLLADTLVYTLFTSRLPTNNPNKAIMLPS